MAPCVLEVSKLTTEFNTAAGAVRVVDGLSLRLERGQALGLVGESGCGKTTVALSILGLVSAPGRITGGQVLLGDQDLLQASPAQLRRVRGRQVAMIFQEPAGALNPVIRVGEQVAETLRLHLRLSRSAARERTCEVFGEVGIPSPEARYDDFPHQLSGGMRQRVLLAGALACEPLLLLADEPTTALDVTLQAQMLHLLRAAQRRTGMSILLISHDLALVASFCQQVLVLLDGSEVESAPSSEIFCGPRHPYTRQLIRASRLLAGHDDHPTEHPRGGAPRPQRGCLYAHRCPRVEQRCRDQTPRVEQAADGRRVRCFFPLEDTDQEPG